MAVFGERIDQVVPARLGIDRDDLAARHSYVVRIVFGEVQQIAQHLPLDQRQIAGAAVFRRLFAVLPLMFVDRFFQLRAQRAFAVIGVEEFPDSEDQPAATLRVSRG